MVDVKDKLVEEVRVMNSEIHTHYYMYIRRDRLVGFYDFMLRNRKTVSFGLLPGYSAATVLGLSAIFAHIPSKFPITDIIHWLRDEQKNYLGSYPNPTLTAEEICTALAEYSRVMSQLRCDGSEIS
jgi:hypothetical protein